MPANDAAAQASLALSNMRGLVILTVLAFHAVLAYLGSQGPQAFPFDAPPYEWRAFPIVDSHRWYGFDLFCAWQDVYLMSLMFFLSALFTWPSLRRKGARTFLSDRFLAIGVPFLFALAVIVPIAVYPAYRVTAADPSVAAYAAHWLALPFWPNGPMWFLWQLLALAMLAALLYRFAPRWVDMIGRLSSGAAARPNRYFIGLAAASALAYVPLALIWTPWAWSDGGPFAIQLSRPLHYAVYFFAGLGIGAYGYERGLLAPGGALARGWASWLALALGFLALWMGVTAWAMAYGNEAPFGLQIAVGASFALACASGSLFVMAVCLRFGTRRSRVLDSLSERSFGLYLVHYVYVVWLQYALLDLDLPAVVKAATVFGGTLVLSWTTVTVLRFVPFGPLLLGAGRRGPRRTPAPARRPTPGTSGTAPDFHLPNAVR
jgi:peptidoglycan/LPS O-acetylase OafA/YrhL